MHASAKTGSKIESLFNDIGKVLIKRAPRVAAYFSPLPSLLLLPSSLVCDDVYPWSQVKGRTQSVMLEGSGKKKKKGCCGGGK